MQTDKVSKTNEATKEELRETKRAERQISALNFTIFHGNRNVQINVNSAPICCLHVCHNDLTRK